jgi:hypothetical protein
VSLASIIDGPDESCVEQIDLADLRAAIEAMLDITGVHLLLGRKDVLLSLTESDSTVPFSARTRAVAWAASIRAVVIGDIRTTLHLWQLPRVMNMLRTGAKASSGARQ